MSRLIWKPEYEFGIEKIDEAHKQLMLLCRMVYEALLAGRDREVLGHILNALQRYAIEHCREEEAELAAHHSHHISRMKTAHKVLETQLAVIVDGFGVRPYGETLTDLTDWLETGLLPHLVNTDMVAFLEIPEFRKENARRRAGL